MSAAVHCGTKRPFVQDIIHSPPSTSYKRLRCYSPTPSEAATENLPVNGDEWVDLLVREVIQSSGKDDAKVRAARVLEALEKMLTARAHQEAVAMQQQVDSLIKDNTVLKRAVAIQHQRHKTHDELIQQLIPQYQENLRNLEMNNYALRMQLQQLDHDNSIPTKFNPHVF